MSLKLEIITPEKVVFNETVEGVILPTETGEVGILPGHIPLLTIINPGKLQVTQEGKREDIAVDKGFARILGDTVSVLTEAAIDIEEIDIEAVEAAQERAEAALRKARTENTMDPAEIEKLESIIRFSIAQKLTKQKSI
jgi:F-type H+-transporting ATPase subunit epsilon